MEEITSISKKINFKSVWKVLKASFIGFNDDNIPKYSSSLAYATIFSIAPFFIIIITVLSYFFGKDGAAENQIFSSLNGFIGDKLALNIQEIIKNASVSDKDIWSKISGTVIVIVGATSVFAEIQDSLNKIWGIKPKPKRGWLQMIKNRLISFSLILSTGFVLLVAISLTSGMQIVNERLISRFPDVAVVLVNLTTFLVSGLVTFLLFSLIFKMLPDAKIKMKDIAIGALVTTLLFLIGQKLISLYMEHGNPGSAFGAAAFVVLILLWVYYSALILYFGAEFTKAWAIELGGNIYPAEYAVTTKIIEVQKENKPVETLNKEEIDTTTAKGRQEAEKPIEEKAREEVTVEKREEQKENNQ